jgi:hypothetical protein
LANDASAAPFIAARLRFGAAGRGRQLSLRRDLATGGFGESGF